MNEQALKALAAQLRQPHGDKGIEVGEMMHASNIGMTRHAIECLDLKDGEAVLELGHGNAAHLSELFQLRNQLHYSGLDISELMHEEATKLNRVWIEKGIASFHLYDGIQIPFQNNSFDKIFTVNTIYFWEEPLAMLGELHRVIRPGGRLTISYGQRNSMIQMPFTQYGFRLYDNAAIESLVEPSSFSLLGIENQTEILKSKTGEKMTREFATAILVA